MARTTKKGGQKIMTDQAFQFLKSYINNASPTGFESGGQKLWLEYVKPYVDTHITDPYGSAAGIINPSEFAPGNSIEAVLWVAVGGRGTLIGPVIGAFIVNWAKTYLTGALPEVWLFALGALFIVVTLFLPKGVVGIWAQLRGNKAKTA